MTTPRPARQRLAELVDRIAGAVTRDDLEDLALAAYQEGFADGRQSPPAIVKIGPATPPELET
jgi:hypothetical protein